MRFNNNVVSFRFVVVALGILFASACGGSPTAPSLGISPSSAEVAPGSSVSFTATGGSDYSWSLTPTNCGSLLPSGDKAEFRAGMQPMSCRVVVSSGSREAAANVTVTSNPAPPPEPVRAYITPLIRVFEGDPDCRTCQPPAQEVKPNADGCYVMTRNGVIEGHTVVHPKKPGRSIRLTKTLTGSDGFVNGTSVREYPDESQIVALVIGFSGTSIGASHTPVGTYQFRLEEFGGDLVTPTDVSEFLKVCRP